MAGTVELTAESFPTHARALAARHPELDAIVARWGLPEFWCRKPGIESLVQIILEQQISFVAAKAIHARLKASLGRISARRLRAAGPDALRSIGLTRQKSRYCYELANAIVERRLSLGRLSRLDDRDAIAALTAQPGIGPWTASIYLLSALGRIDIWPPGDLALRQGIADLLPGGDIDSLAGSGDRWHPRRAVAARLVWHHYRQLRTVNS